MWVSPPRSWRTRRSGKPGGLRWDSMARATEELALLEEGDALSSARMVDQGMPNNGRMRSVIWSERTGQRPESATSWKHISHKPLTRTNTGTPSVVLGRTAEFYSGPSRCTKAWSLCFFLVRKHLFKVLLVDRRSRRQSSSVLSSREDAP